MAILVVGLRMMVLLAMAVGGGGGRQSGGGGCGWLGAGTRGEDSRCEGGANGGGQMRGTKERNLRKWKERKDTRTPFNVKALTPDQTEEAVSGLTRLRRMDLFWPSLGWDTSDFPGSSHLFMILRGILNHSWIFNPSILFSIGSVMFTFLLWMSLW